MWAWWAILVIPGFGKWTQKEQFKVILSYTVTKGQPELHETLAHKERCKWSLLCSKLLDQAA